LAKSHEHYVPNSGGAKGKPRHCLWKVNVAGAEGEDTSLSLAWSKGEISPAPGLHSPEAKKGRHAGPSKWPWRGGKCYVIAYHREGKVVPTFWEKNLKEARAIKEAIKSELVAGTAKVNDERAIGRERVSNVGGGVNRYQDSGFNDFVSLPMWQENPKKKFRVIS